MKKFVSFLGFCAYIVGAIGGFGYSLHSDAVFIAICVVALAVMAFPTFKSFWNNLNGVNDTKKKVEAKPKEDTFSKNAKAKPKKK